jgi:hypothetical protein
MKRGFFYPTGILAVAAGLFAPPAFAQLVQVRDAVGGESENGNPPGFYLTGTGALTRSTNGLDEFFRDIATGTFDLEYDLGLGAGWQELLTYCLEITQQIGFGVNTEDNAVGLPYELEPLTAFPGLTGADQIALEILWSNAHADSMTSPVKAAAFQALTWELVIDGSVDLLSGGFILDDDPHAAAVLAQANAWYDNIENGTWTTRTELMLLSHPDSQDLIIPIPEPATLSLLLIGAGAVLRRKWTS